MQIKKIEPRHFTFRQYIDNKLDLNIDGEYSLNNNKYENFNFKITKDKKKFNLTSSLDFNRKVNFSILILLLKNPQNKQT